MEFIDYKMLVKSIPLGKKLPDAIYLHQSVMRELPISLNEYLNHIINKLEITKKQWNILKLSKTNHQCSLLYYPDFFTYAYPALHTSYTINLEKQTVRKSNYSDSTNPPILHRKETLISFEHKDITTFLEITREGEAIGLYENTKKIGFKNNWEKLIQSKGYQLDKKGRLKPLSEEPADTPNEQKKSSDKKLPPLRERQHKDVKVERHLTAIDRNKLSSPMQVLARHGYLDGDYNLLDYGCGKGDDVSELEAHGLNVSSWDPVHKPDGERVKSDIVNLGFVINVIEQRNERNETIKSAYSYAEKMIVISAMVAGESVIRQFTPYKDGIITSRNTFQKYFTQAELKGYIESVLKESAIAVGQGIFVVFKDKLEEQLFLIDRQNTRKQWRQRIFKVRESIDNTEKAKRIIDRNLSLFTDFWHQCLELGRIPANSEFDFSEDIRRLIGSHNKAHQALINYFGEEAFIEAEGRKKEDLIVYFALGMFEKRKYQSRMPESLKRDIKYFFGNKKTSDETAITYLYSVGNPALIEEKSIEAYQKHQIGEWNEHHSWIIPGKLLEELPPELRIYVGCATQLYGDIDEFHLIKIHFTSGKVSLLRYEDWNIDTPMLIERVKIKLREQDIDFFDYVGEFEPKPLLNKSLY